MATTSSSNYTGLYGANASPIVPTNPYGNADVVALLAASTDGSNTIGNISATGNITGVYLFGNGSQLTGLGATYSNATVSSYLASGLNTANIITTANITGGNLTTIGVGGSITGANLITADQITATGNITAGNFYGNGAGITGLVVAAGTQIINGTSNVSVDLNGNARVTVAGATVATFAANGLITGGNVQAGNVQALGLISAGGNVVGANVNADGNITAGGSASMAGNVTGNYFIGNGSALTGVTATIGPTISVTGNITGGNILTGGVISSTGNITGSYFLGNGSALTGITATAANSATYLTASSNAAAYVSVDDSIKAVNVPGGALISYLGDGVDPNTFGSIDIVNPQTNLANSYIGLTWLNTANFAANPLNIVNVNGSGAILAYDVLNTPKNLLVGATGVTTNTTFSAAGNVTAPYFVGNGSALTDIVSSYGNANVAGNLAAFANNPISTTGNVTASYFIGNGSLLSSITGANVTGTVANATTATTAGTVTTAAQGNITSLGTLTSLSVSGNVIGGNIVGVSASVATGMINYKDYVYTITYASTITPDTANGSIQQVTLTGNVTLNAFGGTPQAGQSMVIKLVQDGTGSRILSSTMKWAGGTKTLSTAANAIDIASIFYDGSTYFASLTKGYA